MFGGIRARLLGSYVLLLVVTLAVMAGALIFILSASPATNQRQVTQQLVRFIADELRTYLQASQRRPSVEGWLTAMADADPDIRVITINDRTNAVVTDSASQFQPGTVLQLQGTPIRDANPMPGNMPFMGNGDAVRLTEGAFSQDGSLWLFVRLNADRGRLGWLGRSVIVATEPPTLSLLQAIDQFQENLGAALVQAALVGGLIAVLLAVLITRTIARPLQTVAQAAAAVAEGDYSQRVPQRGPSEVRELAGAFNRMSKQVQLNNQAQQDWLANISHDLKTPLTSIRGYSQAIQDGTAPDPSRAAAIIYGESERLTRLVSQLTELARLRAVSSRPSKTSSTWARWLMPWHKTSPWSRSRRTSRCTHTSNKRPPSPATATNWRKSCITCCPTRSSTRPAAAR